LLTINPLIPKQLVDAIMQNPYKWVLGNTSSIMR
jgi:hypothetical protein